MNQKRSFPCTVNAIYCRNRNGQKLRCEILEKKLSKDSKILYYVHYENHDKRMDEWVTADRLESMAALSLSQKRPKKQPVQSTPNDTSLSSHHETVMIKNIDKVVFGEDVMEAWYFSPIPEGFIKEENNERVIYFCDFCLRFFSYREELNIHNKKCKMYHPPGNEIYRARQSRMIINVFEVDGEVEVEYTQNLCYLSKLFLDHKTLQYDTVPFLFYVLCEITPFGCRFIGYFSKEKFSEYEYNLACIMTLPCYQKRGFGNFLISLSYELSKIENKIGTPERPLSDMGETTYKKYWYKRIVEYLQENTDIETVTLKQLSEVTFFKVQDIVDALTKFKCLINNENGQAILVSQIKESTNDISTEKYVNLCDPKKLHWVPYKNETIKQT